MSETKVTRLDGVLTELITAASGIDAAAVVSFDGLMMASALPSALDEDRVAAMSAALLSLGEQAIEGFGCGQLDQLFAEGDQGFVVMLAAGDEAVLTAVAQREAKLGFVLYEMRRAADDVAGILSRRTTDEEPDQPQDVASPMPVHEAPIQSPSQSPSQSPIQAPVHAPDHPPLPTRPLFSPVERAAEPHQAVLNGAAHGRTTPPAAWQ